MINIDPDLYKLLRRPDGKLALPAAIEQGLLPSEDPALIPVRPPRNTLYPSSASAVVKDPITGMEVVIGTCIRKAWYELKGVPPDIGEVDPRDEARMQRVMRLGDLMSNAFVYEPAKRMGLWAGDEISFYEPVLRVNGRLDLMSFLPGSTVKSGVEVKSMSPYMDIPWVKAGERGFEHLEPRFNDLPQTMTYMVEWWKRGVRIWHMYYMTRDAVSRGHALVWANVPKDAKEVPEDAYLIAMTDEKDLELPWLTWGQVLRRYQRLWAALESDDPPPRDFQKQWDNAFLLEASKHAGKGSQLVPVGSTDAKKIQSAYASESEDKGPNPATHKPYLLKGDFNCNYCDWRETCWSGLGNPKTPAVPGDAFEKAKTPSAPPATKVSAPKPTRAAEPML